MVARGTWTRDRLGLDRDPRPATDEEYSVFEKAKAEGRSYSAWEERKREREMQTQIEHAEHLAAKYRPTQEQINAVFSRLLAEYEPLPFTARCPTSLVDVDDLEDLKETERGAVR